MVEVVSLEEFQVLLQLQVKMVVLVVEEVDLILLLMEQKEREIHHLQLPLKDKMAEQVMVHLQHEAAVEEELAEQEHPHQLFQHTELQVGQELLVK